MRRNSIIRRIGRCTTAIIILALVILVLQVYNLFLLYKMESREFASDARGESQSMFKWPWILWETSDDFKNPKIQLKLGTPVGLFNALPDDKSGQYKIRHFYVRPEHNSAISSDRDVTLITQCSANNLHHLILMANRWQGPMSIAVFVPGHFAHLSHRFVYELRECSPTLKANASFHMVYPKAHLPSDSEFMYVPLNHHLPCEVIQKKAKTIPGMNYALMQMPYPNNLLRNVARKHVASQFIFLVDIDTIPSQGLRAQYNSFAAAFHLFEPAYAREAVVYVVPVFEMQHGKPPPATKSKLLEAVRSGLARQFYVSRCFKCHSPTDYAKWLSFDSAQNSVLRPLYMVEWHDAYEPFYIGRNTVPLYDERFKQYGFNRISQVCETNMAGYQFAVLDHAFLVHEGFKMKDEFHASKDAENARNRELYKKFKHDMRLKYPNSKRSCD